MGLCDDLISKDITINCNDPFASGIEAEGVIINRSDIDFSASEINADRKNVIDSIVLKTGKKAFKVVQLGNNPFTGTNVSLVVGTYRNTFTNTVNLVVMDNDPDVCSKIIDGIANGTYVVILENVYKGKNKKENPGDAAFQVFGWYQGLRANEITNEKYSEDTDGGWLVSLQETKAPKSGLFLYKNSYDATKTMVDTLTEPAS